MQDASQNRIVIERAGTARRLLAPALILASMVGGSVSVRLFAADKSPTKIAKTVDDSVSLGSSKAGEKHPLLPALQIAKSSRLSVSKVKDYSATFIKQERFKDQLIRQTMDIKVRQEPFSVYLKYAEPHAGREVIFVDGQNKGKFLVHEDGLKSLAGTFSFLPTSDEAMKENHYPVTKIGLANMIDITILQWEQEMKYGEIDVKFYPNAKLGTRECKMIASSHPQARPHFKFQKTCLYIDKETNLPVRIEQFGFPKGNGESPLIEEYNYTNLRINVKLSDRDFDTKNKDYNF